MQRSLGTVLVVGVTLVAALVDVSTAAPGSSSSSVEAKFVSGAAPPLPWIQHGSAYIQLVNVPLAAARKCVPNELDIVETKAGSGVTQGSIYVAKYDNTSAVEYSELIFICATVKYLGETGNWVDSIFVDSEVARDAGINVWHLPKSMATFDWDRMAGENMQHVKVTSASVQGGVVADMTFNDKATAIPFMHQTIRTFSFDDAKANIFTSETLQKYSVKLLSDSSINIPQSSPFAPYFSVANMGKKVEMSKATFNMAAPSSAPLIEKSRARAMFKTTPEVGLTNLPIHGGPIPAWFRGTLIRNSPGGYENGVDEVRHWNDGWAQLHQWIIAGDASDATVTHMSRWLNSSSYAKAVAQNSIDQVGYGTPAHPGPRPRDPIPQPKAQSKAAGLAAGAEEALPEMVEGSSNGLSDRFAVNPMVNVWKFDEKFMATTDQNLFVEFDPESLKTKGKTNAAWDPNDPITKKGVSAIGVAHGRYDRWAKEHFWLEIDFAVTVKKAKYNVWTYKESGFNSSGTLPPREILGSFEDDKTSFVHSFGLTENYIVIIQAPMHYDFLKFITAKSVIETISWDDTTPTKFHIMNRKTGKIVNTISSSDGAWFVYHVLNAFETSDGNIVLDFSKYHNDTLITYGMYLENIVDNPRQYVPTYEQARLTRCILNPQAGTSDCGSVIDKTFEMGTFNWEYKHMKPYRYAWGASFKDANLPWKHGESDFIDQIIKVDLVQNATVASWSRQGFFVCEPLFQQRPGAEQEDDGVLLFVGFDSSKEESWLFFLNGTTLEEIASAPMDGRLAANFHGKWWPEGKDYVIGL